MFQDMTIQDALTNKNSVWDVIKGERSPSNHHTADESAVIQAEKARHYELIKDELLDAGVELDNRRGIIVSDIRLPQNIVQLRELELEGKQQALRNAALGKGYAEVVNIVKRELNMATNKEAIDYINAQKLLEVLPNTSANVVMVGGQGGVQGFLTGITGTSGH